MNGRGFFEFLGAIGVAITFAVVGYELSQSNCEKLQKVNTLKAELKREVERLQMENSKNLTKIAELESKLTKQSSENGYTANRNRETKRPPGAAQSTQIGNPNPFSLYNNWKGHYVCGQGRTSLTFRVKSTNPHPIETDLGKAYGVEAIFDFDFRNRDATGAFYVHGNYYPDTKVAIFEPGDWIRNPSGYVSVGMDGKVSASGTSYTGNILSRGCKEFSLSAQN